MPHLNFQFLCDILAQEVSDLLVVNLDVAHADIEQRVVVLLRLLALEDVHDGPGDEADVVGVLLHREGLPGPRLTVGQDGGVVTLKETLKKSILSSQSPPVSRYYLYLYYQHLN